MPPAALTISAPAAGTIRGSVAEILRVGASPGLPGWATGSDTARPVWKGFERDPLSKVIPEFAKASGFEAALVQSTIDSPAVHGGVSDQIAAGSMAKAMKAAVRIISAVQHPPAGLSVATDLASFSSVVSLPSDPEENPLGEAPTEEARLRERCKNPLTASPADLAALAKLLREKPTESAVTRAESALKQFSSTFNSAAASAADLEKLASLRVALSEAKEAAAEESNPPARDAALEEIRSSLQALVGEIQAVKRKQVEAEPDPTPTRVVRPRTAIPTTRGGTVPLHLLQRAPSTMPASIREKLSKEDCPRVDMSLAQVVAAETGHESSAAAIARRGGTPVPAAAEGGGMQFEVAKEDTLAAIPHLRHELLYAAVEGHVLVAIRAVLEGGRDQHEAL